MLKHKSTKNLSEIGKYFTKNLPDFLSVGRDDEQALRYAVILMDYADETKHDYDELLIERNKSGGYWLHFAVRPKDNRRKTMFLQV